MPSPNRNDRFLQMKTACKKLKKQNCDKAPVNIPTNIRIAMRQSCTRMAETCSKLAKVKTFEASKPLFRDMEKNSKKMMKAGKDLVKHCQTNKGSKLATCKKMYLLKALS